MTQTETQQEAPAVEQAEPAPEVQASDFQALIAKARAPKPQRMTPTDLDLAKRMALMYGRGPKKRDPYAEESEYYLHCLRKYNLDPMQRQICAVWRWDKNANDEVMTVQTQIDGYRCLAARTGEYAGSDDPAFHLDDNGGIVSCTQTVWRIVKGHRVPFTATAWWNEYKPSADFMWNRMPHTMLAKCAEALALRKAFPADLGGLYVDAEMEQAVAAPSDAPPPAPDAAQAPTRQQRQEPPPLDFKAIWSRWCGLAAARKAAGDATWADYENPKKAGAWFRAYVSSLLGKNAPKPEEFAPEEFSLIMADMEKHGDPRTLAERETRE